MNAQSVIVTAVPTLQQLDRAALAGAEQVAVFQRSAALSPAAAVVVELRDAYGNLLARSVVETEAPREAVSAALLDAVDLERCSDFVIDPLARKRLVAAVCPRASAALGRFERVQGRGRISA